MGRFRQRLRPWVCLALVALALNLAWSFGHHHFGEATVHQAATAESPPGTEHAGGEDQDHQNPSAAHPCFICVVATAAAIAASPPALPAPAEMPSIEVAAIASVESLASACTVFDARAPPRS